MRTLLALLFTTTLAVAQPTNFADWLANYNYPKRSEMLQVESIYANSNFVVSADQVASMRMSNIVFVVDSSSSNIVLTMPPYFENIFSVLNLGTNWVTMQAAEGNKFLLAPMDGSISYSDTLVNKYALKVHTLFHVSATNVVVQSEFRPLPNVVFAVTNNIVWPESGGGGVAQTNISHAAVTNLSSYSVLDNQIASTIARDSEVAAATNNLDAAKVTVGNLSVSRLNGGTSASSSTFWRGDGTWATPAGGGGSYRTKLEMTTNFVNAHAVANTLTNIPQLSFAVVAGTTYKIKAVIYFTTAATTTGSRWTITGPTMTACALRSEYTLTATTTTRNAMLQNTNLPAAANLTSAAGVNMAEITGIFRPSANGTVSVAFASEILSSAVTAQAGSTLEYW